MDNLFRKIVFVLLGLVALVAAIFFVKDLGWMICLYCVAATLIAAPFASVHVMGLWIFEAFLAVAAIFSAWIKIFGSASDRIMRISVPLFWSGVACFVISMIVGAIMELSLPSLVKPRFTEASEKKENEPKKTKVRKSSGYNGFSLGEFVMVGTTVGIVLFAILFGYWFFYGITNSTIYSFEYQQAKEVYCENINSYNSYYGDLCNYPDCTQVATTRVWLDPVFPDVMPKGINLLMKMPNKAGFQFISDSYSYTEKNKENLYNTTLFLIPSGDGSITIGAVTEKFTFHVNGKQVTSSFISFEGHYCDDHQEIARRTWLEEVEETFVTKNIGYYFDKYGFWASLSLIPLAIVLSMAVYGVVRLCHRKRKYKFLT